LPWSPRDVT